MPTSGRVVPERLLHARFAQSVVPQASLDLEGTVLEANAAAARLLGWSTSELVGVCVRDLLPPADVASLGTTLQDLVDGDLAGARRSRRVRRRDGTYLDVVLSTVVVRDDRGEPLRLEVVLEDVGERARTERELQAREARWRALALNGLGVGVLTEADGTIRFATDTVRQHLGHEHADVVGRSWFDGLHRDEVASVRAAWERALARPGEPVRVEARVRHADGSWRWSETTVTSRLDDPSVAAVVVTLSDIEPRKAAEAGLRELALRDPLTGLANRTLLVDRAGQALRRAERSGERVALLLVDLDDFKVVNDSYGHATGDEVLVEVADRLRAHVREVDTLARLGGDDFAVLQEGAAGEAEARALAERLVRALLPGVRLGPGGVLADADADADAGTAAHVEAGTAADAGAGAAAAADLVALTASVGVAVSPAESAESLLSAAEAAMYAAKDRGRAQVEAFVEQHRSAGVGRLRRVADLRRGLAAGELVVHYQPLVELASGQVEGVEALARWRHPERGLVEPVEFIDLAEESGLIVPLGEAVLREACTAAARWSGLGPGGTPLRVAVNFSARQLVEPSVVDLVAEVLHDTAVAPEAVTLEVTETAVMSDVAHVTEVLESVRALGVGLAVDDFGTGYSSFTYLKRFPVTEVKIDRSFVAGLGTGSDDAAIVASVLSLCRAVGVDSVGEGVETETQLAALRALGCGRAQGYLWSRALGATEVEELVRRHRDIPLTWSSGAGRSGRVPAVPALREPGDLDDVTLQRIHDLHAQGASLSTIAAALNAAGLLRPNGRRWQARSVARVVAATLS